MSQLPEFESRNPFHRANALTELISWNDIDFVRCAYVTMLGRQPDLPGQTHNLEKLRAGDSKLDILWRLRASPEARQHDPGIAGLDRALKRAALQRRPLLGAMSRFLRPDADSNSRNSRALRVLTNATFLTQHYVQALSGRLTVHSGLMGFSPPSLEAKQADQILRCASPRFEQAMNAEMTPELNHLRGSKVNIARLIKGVTP